MSDRPFRWSNAEVLSALASAFYGGDAAPLRKAGRQGGRTTFSGVSTDSRTLEPGALFVALVGERFDGHDFIPEAFRRGARGAVLSRTAPEITGTPDEGVGAPDGGLRLFHVPDTLVALGALAAHRRSALSSPVVGITGSSGKTTTKELVAAALGKGARAHLTVGNLNNRIGVPLTLLAAPDEADAVVIEMGTNEPGEIATLAGIAAPDTGAVVTVGESHVEKLGSFEGVLNEKLSLLTALPASGPAPVVGDAPRVLAARAREVRPDVRVAGTTGSADRELRAESIRTTPEGRTRFTWRGIDVRLGIPGRHAVTDALIALGLAETLGADPVAAAAGLERARPGPMRSELRSVGGLELLVDCYNANPQSLAAALDLLGERGRARPSKRSVAVLGSMLELGAQSDRLHERALEDALSREIDLLVATGEFARAAARMETNGSRVIQRADWRAAWPALCQVLDGDETILLKASRGIALEGLVPLIERAFATGDPAGKLE